MASVSTINLDIDQVFAQNSISEVESINRKMQSQIESKREELRLMVRKLILESLQCRSD